MITGNHRHADTASMALLDGFDRFLARWIEQADEPKEHQILWQIRRTQAPRLDVRIFEPCKTQYALTLGGELVRGFHKMVAVDWHGLRVFGCLPIAMFEDHLRRALH